jgi:hypothetical protein
VPHNLHKHPLSLVGFDYEHILLLHHNPNQEAYKSFPVHGTEPESKAFFCTSVPSPPHTIGKGMSNPTRLEELCLRSAGCTRAPLAYMAKQSLAAAKMVAKCGCIGVPFRNTCTGKVCGKRRDNSHLYSKLVGAVVEVFSEQTTVISVLKVMHFILGLRTQISHSRGAALHFGLLQGYAYVNRAM